MESCVAVMDGGEKNRCQKTGDGIGCKNKMAATLGDDGIVLAYDAL